MSQAGFEGKRVTVRLKHNRVFPWQTSCTFEAICLGLPTPEHPFYRLLVEPDIELELAVNGDHLVAIYGAREEVAKQGREQREA